MNTLKAWRLQKDCLSGDRTWGDTVYTSEIVAKRIAQNSRDEFSQYLVREVTVRVLSYNEGAVDRDLVTIDRITADEHLALQVLAKLTPEERQALAAHFKNASNRANS